MLNNSRLPFREPGVSVPGAVREAAARAGRQGRRPVDPALLRRVRDALAVLPDTALTPHYSGIPGECLGSPRVERR